MRKTIFMAMATASLVFASCNDKAKTAEGDATAADSIQVEAEAVVESEPEASVVGVWKLTNIDLGMEAPKGQEQALEDIKKKMIAETVYTFNEDGTMTFKNSMVKETSATYTYEDSKITITDNKTKKAETVTVDELTADKLVISSEQNGKKAVMTFSK
jgi:hypothetical protein